MNTVYGSVADSEENYGTYRRQKDLSCRALLDSDDFEDRSRSRLVARIGKHECRVQARQYVKTVAYFPRARDASIQMILSNMKGCSGFVEMM